eukprot:7630437-Ditylum_brightwellii.AAC.2
MEQLMEGIVEGGTGWRELLTRQMIIFCVVSLGGICNASLTDMGKTEPLIRTPSCLRNDTSVPGGTAQEERSGNQPWPKNRAQ